MVVGSCNKSCLTPWPDQVPSSAQANLHLAKSTVADQLTTIAPNEHFNLEVVFCDIVYTSSGSGFKRCTPPCHLCAYANLRIAWIKTYHLVIQSSMQIRSEIYPFTCPSHKLLPSCIFSVCITLRFALVYRWPSIYSTYVLGQQVEIVWISDYMQCRNCM